MEAILNSKLFIPTCIFIGAALISIIVLVIFSKSKKKKERSLLNDNISLGEPTSDVEKRIQDAAVLPVVPMENTKEDILPKVEPTVVPIVPVTPKEETVVPTVPMTSKEETVVPVVEVNKTVEPVVVKKEVDLGPPPTIDIPIPTVDDSPITVDEVKSLVGEDLQDSVQVEKFETVDESNVQQDEIISVNEAKQLVEETQETVKVEEVKSIENEVGDTVEVDETKQLANDIGETAFKSIPNGDTNINTDIKVEPINTVTNKTEIFDLEAIQRELQKMEEAKRELL